MSQSQSTRVGDYELLAKLGEGGMGAVYRARQMSMDREVALKVLPRRFASNEEYIQRFLREARATAKLNHLNIVAGIDVGNADGYYYFAMELVEGTSWKSIFTKVGRLAEAEVARVGEAIALALGHAHANGIVHRDVKPDNIIIAVDGTPKLADLGLAKGGVEDDASLTQSGVTVGTPHYMAPEQARGDADVNGRADIYSLGCTMYHAATGKTPFEGTTAMLLVKQLQEKIPHPKSIRPDLSDDFCRVLDRMLARAPGDRYQSAEEAAADLHALRQGEPPMSAPISIEKSNFVPLFKSISHKKLSAAERSTSRRMLSPVTARDADTKPTTRTRSAVKNSGNRWLVPAGVLGVLVVAVFVATRSSTPAAPSNTTTTTPGAVASKEPEKVKVPVAPVTPTSPTAPTPPVATQSDTATIRKNQSDGQTSTPPADTTPKDPAVSPPVPAPSTPVNVDASRRRFMVGDKIPLLSVNDPDLHEWKKEAGEWHMEGDVLVGTGAPDRNGSIQRFNVLPEYFVLNFKVRSAASFHFGYDVDQSSANFINVDPSEIRLTSYSNVGAVAGLSSGVYDIGTVERNFEIHVAGTHIEVKVDGKIITQTEKGSRAPGVNRALYFFTSPKNTIHVRDLSYQPMFPADNGGQAPAPAPAPAPTAIATPPTPATPPVDEKALKAAVAYAAFFEQYLAQFRKVDSKCAATQLDQALKNPDLQPLLQRVESDRRALAWLEDLKRAEIAGAMALKNIDEFELKRIKTAPMKIGKKTGILVTDVSPAGAMKIAGQGAAFDATVQQLLPETRQKLMDLGLAQDGKDAACRAALVIAQCTNSDGLAAAHAAAEKAFAAQCTAEDKAVLERWLSQCMEGYRNSVAEAAWQKVSKLDPKADPKNATLALQGFKAEFTGTLCLATHRAEYDRLLQDAQTVLAPSAVPAPKTTIELLTAVIKALQVANPRAKPRQVKNIRDMQDQLVGLEFIGNGIGDFSPLLAIPTLRFLKLAATDDTCTTSDLSVFKTLPLEELEIDNWPVKDLSPLKGMNLRRLSISGCPVTDLRPLAGMATLQELRMAESKCMDVEPLRGLKLKSIVLDFKPELHSTLLLDMKSLETINGIAAEEFRKRMKDKTLAK